MNEQANNTNQEAAVTPEPVKPVTETVAAVPLKKDFPAGLLKAILGTKVGMTRIFEKNGDIIPVTLISAGPCPVVQVKTKAKDGYDAVQIGWVPRKAKSLPKANVKHFEKAGLQPFRFLREFHITGKLDGVEQGQEVKCGVFSPGDFIDVSGVTKGKGFAGVMKRHNFGGGPRTHGQSDRQRHAGSIGSQGPQRVLKGTRMAGHMGNNWKTIQRIKIVDVIPEKNLIAVQGSVPGPDKGLLILQKTVKRVKIKKLEQMPAKALGKGKAPEKPAKKEAPKKAK